MTMTVSQPTRPTDHDPAPRVSAMATCLGCGARLAGRATCPACGRLHAESGGIVEAIGELSGRNRIAARFYDGPGWRRFRIWERLFLRLHGGEARARRQILRHVDGPATARVLEVGIGDGENLGLLPAGWVAYGVDIARGPLEGCIARAPGMAGRLALAEGEALPFEDGAFDACFSVGGFNHFRDHDDALREMRRVTRPGGSLVVADEIPGLHRFGIGHLIGRPAIDAVWLRALGLDAEFAAMVLGHSFDPDPVVRSAWPGALRTRIWAGLGYCYSASSSPPTPAPTPGDHP